MQGGAGAAGGRRGCKCESGIFRLPASSQPFVELWAAGMLLFSAPSEPKPGGPDRSGRAVAPRIGHLQPAASPSARPSAPPVTKHGRNAPVGTRRLRLALEARGRAAAQVGRRWHGKAAAPPITARVCAPESLLQGAWGSPRSEALRCRRVLGERWHDVDGIVSSHQFCDSDYSQVSPRLRARLFFRGHDGRSG